MRREYGGIVALMATTVTTVAAIAAGVVYLVNMRPGSLEFPAGQVLTGKVVTECSSVFNRKGYFDQHAVEVTGPKGKPIYLQFKGAPTSDTYRRVLTETTPLLAPEPSSCVLIKDGKSIRDKLYRIE